MRKNNPYGTRPDSTAAVCTTRTSVKPSSAACSRIAPLISTTTTITRRTQNPIWACSGVVSVLALRASAVSRLAWLAPPTSRASCSPSPPTTWLPESRSCPTVRVRASDSPVSSDSSTSTAPMRTGPSTTSWSPGRTRTTSPRTTSSGRTSVSLPSRSTTTVLRPRTCNRSSWRLARISCTALMTAFSRPIATLMTASP